ncbi:Protein F15 [Monkeypox virus]|nr:Protein F15 [Monkeypox virus]
MRSIAGLDKLKMEIFNVEELINMKPFKNINKITINQKDNCILANRCFVKIDTPRYIPSTSISSSNIIRIRNHDFTLSELLYSPFHFQQPQFQYLLPGFVLTCIDKVSKQQKECKYCISNRGDDDSLSINIFIPTINKSIYIIIGLRMKNFWKPKFEIE